MSAQPLPQSPLTPMNAEVTAVLVQGFQRGDIRSSRSNLIHPLDGLHHFVPLLLCKDRGTLVLGNLLWGRNKSPVRSMSYSQSDSQSLPHSFQSQVNLSAGLSSALDHPVVAKEAPDRPENILIQLHFLSIEQGPWNSLRGKKVSVLPEGMSWASWHPSRRNFPLKQ